MQTVQAPPTGTVPARSAEGYAKEIFSTVDASQLPQGPAITGVQAPSSQGAGVQQGQVPITDVFMAILVELRAIHLTLRSLKEPTGVDSDIQHS